MQILCEINLEESKISKNAIYRILESLNLDRTGSIFAQAEIYQNEKKNQRFFSKMAFFLRLSPNLISRKNL